jgi:phenylacetate-coenzyme A ligase PaaK-like adenylate-forming protein
VQIEAAQRDGLRRLLAHAVQHAPFHRRRLAGIDVERFDPVDLPTLPAMTKAEMMAELDDVFTDRRLTRPLVEEAIAATGAEPVPILEEYIAFASGGSSGQRGLFVFDRTAMAGFLLSVTRSLVARLETLGGPPAGGFRIAMVGAASAVHLTRAAEAATAGPSMPLRIASVPVTLAFQEIVERLETLQPHGLFGYPSTLARLAAEQQAGRMRIAPSVVTTTSETLLPEVAAAMTEAFSAPVVNNFASTEGLVGNSAPGDTMLVFNTDMCIVELVDEGNRPVPPGVPSARVLITNLYNVVQPLIRYELNDTLVRQLDASDHGHLRATVQGRADEMLRYRGFDVHPHVVRSVLVKSREIVDYRVRQTPHGIDVDAVPVGNVDVEGLRGRLVAALAGAGLGDPEVSVRIVDHLERDPKTGKLRRFVPLLHA